MYNFRRISQIIFFLLFIYLLFKTTYPIKIIIPVDFFLRIEPLIFIFTIITTKKFVFNLFIYSLPIIILTLLFGRVFCSFICPMGMLLDILRIRKTHSFTSSFEDIKNIKFYLILFLLIVSIFQTPLFYFFEPITILIRTFTSFINFKLFTLSNLFIISIFIIILLLNLIQRRFFCNYLCPVAATLGLLSQFTILRKVIDEKKCNNCKICINNCPMHALDDNKSCNLIECINCYRCISKCKEKAISLKFKTKDAYKKKIDLERRRFIQSILYSITFVIVANFIRLKNKFLLRPPNAKYEMEFLDLCIRCNKCIKVCPTKGLQPIFFEAGIESLFTPVLIPRVGPCIPYCNLCSQVCPTGAIAHFEIKEKKDIIIGKAKINKDKCLVWYNKKYCFICQEVCPYGAVYQKNMKVYVNSDKCTGCGACEYHCPVEDEAAIRVYNHKNT